MGELYELNINKLIFKKQRPIIYITHWTDKQFTEDNEMEVTNMSSLFLIYL